MGLEVGGGGIEEEEKEKEEKIPLCKSIGHRPFQGRCPAPPSTLTSNLLKQGTRTADHLSLLRLFLFFLKSNHQNNYRFKKNFNTLSYIGRFSKIQHIFSRSEIFALNALTIVF